MINPPDSRPGVRPPSLEVCIPSQRRSPYFLDALGSVAQAKVPGLSLLVFQNSPEPHWREDDLRAFPGPKRLFCSGTALKIGDSWNRVLELCEADWIHILHDDDWIEPDFYQLFLRDLEKFPPFGLWLCGTYENHDTGPAFQVLDVPDLYTRDVEEIAGLIWGRSLSRCVSVIMSRRDALACGGFDNRMGQILDGDLFFRLAAGHGICCHSGAHAHYRVHAASTTGLARKDESGGLVSLPILDDERLPRDYLIFMRKQLEGELRSRSIRRYSSSVIWGMFRYYGKRFRLGSLFLWLRCWIYHLRYCLRS